MTTTTLGVLNAEFTEAMARDVIAEQQAQPLDAAGHSANIDEASAWLNSWTGSGAIIGTGTREAITATGDARFILWTALRVAQVELAEKARTHLLQEDVIGAITAVDAFLTTLWYDAPRNGGDGSWWPEARHDTCFEQAIASHADWALISTHFGYDGVLTHSPQGINSVGIEQLRILRLGQIDQVAPGAVQASGCGLWGC